LTFDLSSSKWGHGSPVSWAFFLPNLSWLRPSVLDLESGTGQTDERTCRQTERQTTAINPLCAHSMGRGIHNKMEQQ